MSATESLPIPVPDPGDPQRRIAEKVANQPGQGQGNPYVESAPGQAADGSVPATDEQPTLFDLDFPRQTPGVEVKGTDKNDTPKSPDDSGDFVKDKGKADGRTTKAAEIAGPLLLQATRETEQRPVRKWLIRAVAAVALAASVVYGLNQGGDKEDSPRTTPAAVSTPTPTAETPTASETSTSSEAGNEEDNNLDSTVTADMLEGSLASQSRIEELVARYPELARYLSDAFFARITAPVTAERMRKWQDDFEVYRQADVLGLPDPVLMTTGDNPTPDLDTSEKNILDAIDNVYATDPDASATLANLAYLDDKLAEAAIAKAKEDSDNGLDTQYTNPTNGDGDLVAARPLEVSDGKDGTYKVTIAATVSEYPLRDEAGNETPTTILNYYALLAAPVRSSDQYRLGIASDDPASVPVRLFSHPLKKPVN